MTTMEDTFPKKYKHPLFSRYFTLCLGILVIAYMFFYIFTQVNLDTPTFRKVLPFIIILFAFDSVSRNLFTLNQITFKETDIHFSFLLKKKLVIKYEDLLKIEAFVTKKKYFSLYYKASERVVANPKETFDVESIEREIKKFSFPMSFANIIEILNLLKTMAPQMETDEFVGSVVIRK